MAVKYGEFKFPSEKGFSGSAGKTMVNGYARGGCATMKKADGGAVSDREAEMMRRAMPSRGLSAAASGLRPGVMSAREAEAALRAMSGAGAGAMSDREAEMMRRAMPAKAKGGKVHEDEEMDKAMMKKMIKPSAMKAKGGKVHEDAAMDKKLVERMVKPTAMKARGGAMKAKGGKVGC